MIGRLEGSLVQLSPGNVLIDAGGVGYLVSTTLRAFETLADSGRASLWIHTRAKEDGIVLFGFPDRTELAAFERLIAVAGVGPRTALAVLSGLSSAELAEAVEAGDFPLLQRIPGVGRKTAERIVLELKGRLDGMPSGEAGADPARDAVSALSNLGYSEREARRAVDRVRDKPEATDLAAMIRLALQVLTT